MRTGLKKVQKETTITFDEQNPWVRVFTYNTDLKNRLTKFAAAYPELCRQTDDDDFGGLTFMVDKKRFSFRLTAPYSDERKQAARELAKKLGLGGNMA